MLSAEGTDVPNSLEGLANTTINKRDVFANGSIHGTNATDRNHAEQHDGRNDAQCRDRQLPVDEDQDAHRQQQPQNGDSW